jgi:predicted enzyme related to lactoylglutathione lyase
MAGKIVHVELPAADVDRATEFWKGLFGWEIGASVMPDFDYRMFQTAEDQGGAIMSSEKPGGAPIVYFDTDNIDASVAKVRELGGKAEDKMPVPTHGWFSPCVDTEGTSFSLWQSDPNAA